MTMVDSQRVATSSKGLVSLGILAKSSTLAALAAFVTQVAANIGLLSISAILKPLFFTTAFAIGAVSFSYFVLGAASVAFVSLVILVLKKRASSSTVSALPPASGSHDNSGENREASYVPRQRHAYLHAPSTAVNRLVRLEYLQHTESL